MLEKVVVDLTGGRPGLLGAVFRYEVMERLARSAGLREVELLAFGFGEKELRLVLQGEPETITNVLRGLKVGTVRAAARWGLALQAGPNIRSPIPETRLTDAVAWAHTAPIEAGASGPLASPWSSHRDLLGYRKAAFYDPSLLVGRIDVGEVQLRCGGPLLPDRWPPHEAPGEDLGYLLRLAGAVLGVLPADRRCFRLFVHLAKSCGWQTMEVARAIDVTTRRVRQLAADVEPQLAVALTSMADPHLSRVP